MRFRLLPTDQRFFELLEGMGQTVSTAAAALAVGFEENADIEKCAIELRRIEHEGDAQLRGIVERLNTSFVTPLDREDILRLAEALDDIIDDIHNVAELMFLTRVQPSLAELHSQIAILVDCAGNITDLMRMLGNLSSSSERIYVIQKKESDADGVYRSAIAGLFGGKHEPLEVMKLRDVVEAIERAVDGMEDVADIVDAIRVKQS